MAHRRLTDEYDFDYLNYEGGNVEAVYRTFASAVGAAQSEPDYGVVTTGWHPVGADLFDPETYWEIGMRGGPTHDIVQVELEGLEERPRSRWVYLVVRKLTDEPDEEGEVLPVCGFGDRNTARARCRELADEIPRGPDLVANGTVYAVVRSKLLD